MKIQKINFPSKTALFIKWFIRIFIALIFSLIIGALPVYISQEYNELSIMKSELSEIKKLNKRLFVDLENSTIHLESLKSSRGIKRILREKGYAPSKSIVYQIEPIIKVEKGKGF